MPPKLYPYDELQLRSCPFCGNTELISDLEEVPQNIRESVWIIICGECGTRGPWGNDEKEAEKLWNIRRR